MGVFGQFWGVVGVVALLSSAVARLAPYAIEALTSPLTGVQWAVVVTYTAFMAHAEGYRGFQKQFSPRAIVRVCLLKVR